MNAVIAVCLRFLCFPWNGDPNANTPGGFYSSPTLVALLLSTPVVLGEMGLSILSYSLLSKEAVQSPLPQAGPLGLPMGGFPADFSPVGPV